MVPTDGILFQACINAYRKLQCYHRHYFQMRHTNIIFKTTAVFCFVIFITQNIIAQPSLKANAKDWLALDPKKDSIAGISLYKAYNLLKGRNGKPVIVAVIDNGVDIEHEDLKNIIWTNTKEIASNGIDDDHNGYVDDVHGWNFRGAKDGTIIENEQSGSTQFYLAWKTKYENADTNLLQPEDKKKFAIYVKAKKDYFEKLNSKDSSDVQFAYNVNYTSSSLIANDSVNFNSRYYGSPYFNLSPNLSHGTHVAGIIAAQRNNNKGINGIAGNVLIMPVVATTATGDERDKDIANAIRYAVNNGAKIINLSFSKLYSSDKKIIDEAIRYAEKKNVLIIHAAGNDGVDNDSASNYHYPIAIYENRVKASNFITVGWSRPLFDYRLAHPYSDYGKMNVDLFAPGSDIFSTVPNNEYDFKSGSSMSAPVVTGVAALLLSYFPSLTTRQVKDILLQSTFKPNQMVNRPQTKIQVPFKSLSVSGGIVNAYNAVKMAIAMTKKK
ncbi:MAG: S8 family peptidase [Bacteroidota bacterium]|nr:S8 family peptidase [Bacteroidota bacterium]